MKVFEKFKDKVVKYHQDLRKKRLERKTKLNEENPPIWRGCAAKQGWIVMESIEGRSVPKIGIDKMAYDYNVLIREVRKINDKISDISNSDRELDGLHG